MSKQHGISVQLLELGGLKGDEAYFFRGANASTVSNPNPEHKWRDLTLYAGLIHHPKHGLFLYETGGSPDPDNEWSSEFLDAFPYTYEPEHRLDTAIAAAGYSIDDVAGVIIGHLHSDHAGGLEFFRGRDIPLYIHEEELKNAFYGVATGEDTSFDHKFLDTSFNWVPVSGTQTELFPGIDLIHLPGHTAGLQGALIQLDQSEPILFVSDQLIFEDHFDGRVQGWLNKDDHQWHESLRRIRRLVASGVRVVYGHDPINGKNFPISPDKII